MLFSDSYFTVSKPAEGIYKDRGSKFLGFIFPVFSETEIKQHLQDLRKEHPSARHHCYAWRLGADKNAYRANDDGEPNNSAGKPILAQIQSNDLTNVLIVVVRYFGGTLLGVSGLINAYKLAAADAIANANIEERFILFEYNIEFNTEDTSPVMRALKENEAEILSNAYDEKNNIVFRVKKQHSEKLEQRFKELYTTKLEFLNLI
ncbi:MAG: YigZ family protein [Bacteroidetes bacterium]|nr:YigZ family protein [Bacteroidota bacterium]